MKIKYNSELKELARRLRNNSTKAEIKLWSCLKGKQLMDYAFHRQKPVENYITDFFCNKLMLAIEVDGYTHGFEEVFEKDKKKEQRLREMGITILRYRDEDVINNIDGVVEDIKDCMKGIENKHTP
ncbi:MAG: endonuclease domain-containing protein [Nitrospiraceae bacterium]|nr:MAG: endonuclease domain-containing protein [Nitrospiraceae bacterium]